MAEHAWVHLPRKPEGTGWLHIHYRCARCGTEATAREIKDKISRTCWGRRPVTIAGPRTLGFLAPGQVAG